MGARSVACCFTLTACGLTAVGAAPNGEDTTLNAIDAGGGTDAGMGGDGDGSSDNDGGGTTKDAYVAAVLADAPIAYWRLEETAGPSIRDERGTYPATATAGTYQKAGALTSQASTALGFDGANTVLKAAAPMPFDGTKPFSIEAWIRPTLQDSYVRWYFTWGDPAGAINGAIQLSGANGALVFVRTAPDTSQGYYLSSTLPLDVFTHVVVTYDGTTQRLYRDAVVVSTSPSAVSLGGPAGYEVRWGDMMKNAFAKYQGEMDELALYDHALSAARVTAHFAAR